MDTRPGRTRASARTPRETVAARAVLRASSDASSRQSDSEIPPGPFLSLPRALRFQAARDEKVVTRLLDLFTRAVFVWQRRSARRTLASSPRTRQAQRGSADRLPRDPARAVPRKPGPRRVEPRTGGVTFVQRFGGALNLNVHFHTLIPDGVFVVEGDAPARFVRLPAPKDEDIQRILTRAIRQIRKEFPERGADDRATDPDDPFAALQAAEVDRRLRFPDPFRHSRCSAHLDGFSLHASVKVHENDRLELERICRYAARPALALHRLSMGEDGRLVYKMKRPRGGSLFLLLTPEELLAKLATLIPPPRSHALRYHGVFAPNSALRKRVVPQREAVTVSPAPSALPPPPPPERSPPTITTPAKASSPSPPPQPAEPPPTRTRVPWAELLQKVHTIDVLACPECGGRLEMVAYINQPKIAKQILDHLGLQSQAPPVARRKPAGPDEAAPGPDYDCADPAPIYDE